VIATFEAKPLSISSFQAATFHDSDPREERFFTRLFLPVGCKASERKRLRPAARQAGRTTIPARQATHIALDFFLLEESCCMRSLLHAVVCVSVAGFIGASNTFAQKRRTVEMPEQILESLTKEDERVRKCVDDSGSVGRVFKTEAIDLSKDSAAIMVRGISSCVCGPRKCVNRIYRPAGNGYELLLNADFAQEIEPQTLYTNGYRNLWAAVYVYRSFTSVLYEYQWDGKQYKWDHCVWRNYYYAEHVNGGFFNGRVRLHQKPEMSWVGCNPLNPYGPM
jgi:hypothetical protein